MCPLRLCDAQSVMRSVTLANIRVKRIGCVSKRLFTVILDSFTIQSLRISHHGS